MSDLLSRLKDTTEAIRVAQYGNKGLRLVMEAVAALLREAREEIVRLTAQRDLAQRLVSGLPLCPDHRDKFRFRQCPACSLEKVEAENQRLREALAHLSARHEWHVHFKNGACDCPAHVKARELLKDAALAGKEPTPHHATISTWACNCDGSGRGPVLPATDPCPVCKRKWFEREEVAGKEPTPDV